MRGERGEKDQKELRFTYKDIHDGSGLLWMRQARECRMQDHHTGNFNQDNAVVLISDPTRAIRVHCDTHYRLIMTEVDGRPQGATFTPTEFTILLKLLPGGIQVSDDLLPAGNLEKHIHNIRSKLAPLGLDVPRITRYGYMLLPSVEVTYL